MIQSYLSNRLAGTTSTASSGRRLGTRRLPFFAVLLACLCFWLVADVSAAGAYTTNQSLRPGAVYLPSAVGYRSLVYGGGWDRTVATTPFYAYRSPATTGVQVAWVTVNIFGYDSTPGVQRWTLRNSKTNYGILQPNQSSVRINFEPVTNSVTGIFPNLAHVEVMVIWRTYDGYGLGMKQFFYTDASDYRCPTNQCTVNTGSTVGAYLSFN